jgi:hypothetical protein
MSSAQALEALSTIDGQYRMNFFIPNVVGSVRPLEARLAPDRSLHDRLIIIDERDSWSLGQSFNALAARAPTSLIRADTETAQLKIQAHAQIWQAADPIQ